MKESDGDPCIYEVNTLQNSCHCDTSSMLWKGPAFPESSAMPLVQGVRFYLVSEFKPEKTGFWWLKGLALARYEDHWIASFGQNTTETENNATEMANAKLSRDQGKSWEFFHTIDNPAGDLAVSHGVFLNHKDRLWSFHGAFYGEGRPGGRVHTRAYMADPGTIRTQVPQWIDRGVVAWDGFWPLQEPIFMDNGRFIIAGASIGGGHIGDKGTIPAVALADSENLTQWEVIRIPVDQGHFNDIWGESTVIVRGSRVLLISRSDHHIGKALVSTSNDYGMNWSSLKESNLPMVNSKPYAGILSDGRPYLINTMGAELSTQRNPLCILLGDPGAMCFNKAFRLIDSSQPPADASKYHLWAYPYAVEWDGELIVGFYTDGSESYGCGAAGFVSVPISYLTD